MNPVDKRLITGLAIMYFLLPEFDYFCQNVLVKSLLVKEERTVTLLT